MVKPKSENPQMIAKSGLNFGAVLLITSGIGVIDSGRTWEGIFVILIGLGIMFYREHIKKYDKKA